MAPASPGGRGELHVATEIPLLGSEGESQGHRGLAEPQAALGESRARHGRASAAFTGLLSPSVPFIGVAAIERLEMAFVTLLPSSSSSLLGKGGPTEHPPPPP